MSKKFLVAIMVLIPLLIVAGITYFSMQQEIAVLSPSGEIAGRQLEVLTFAFKLSILVIVPVFALTGFIALRYRDGNKKAAYQPDWGHSNKLETIWWGIPIFIILILSAVTWRTSHTLDPYKPLDSDVPPLEVQVVSLQWKWLFLYPNQNLASVNYLHIPENTPINFTITSDAPMNSFWIPKLGGQIYAMSGMSTRLHLIANEPGQYKGLSANISGEEFASMGFLVEASSRDNFANWVNENRKSKVFLDNIEYARLAEPGVEPVPIVYSSFSTGLYDRIIEKYVPNNSPGEDNHGGH